MKTLLPAVVSDVIKAYLSSKPFFYSLIRPQEVSLFRKYADFIKPAVLDFGCDDGFFASLAFDPPITYGLDLPGTNLTSPLAQKIYTHRLLYDGGYIPLQNSHVQTIVSNCVFEHVADIRLSFREMFRILKPGGYLVATMLTNKWEAFLMGGKVVGKPYLKFMRHKQVHRNLFSLEDWHNLYVHSGFVITAQSGYLSKETSRLLEAAHYLALPQLLYHRICHKWQLPLPLFNQSLENQIRTIINQDVKTKPEEAACLCIVAQKPLR